jgi:hypothetical protein
VLQLTYPQTTFGTKHNLLLLTATAEFALHVQGHRAQSTEHSAQQAVHMQHLHLQHLLQAANSLLSGKARQQTRLLCSLRMAASICQGGEAGGVSGP